MFRILATFSKWVPHYHLGEGFLGGTTKSHPPQNHKNVDFILIDERTNFKKQFPTFL
jgi:hypothetical protein